MIIDTHAHLDMDAFMEDRAGVIERARESGIGYILNIGCDIESSRRSVELAECHDFIYASAGVHPHDVKDIGDGTYADLAALLVHPKVVAAGEMGLDYFRNHSPAELQRKHFRKQIELAREHGRPIIIHCRDAKEDMIAILSEHYPKNDKARSGIFHCFSGDQELADRALEMGFYVSFSGSVTYPKSDGLRAVAKTIPADRLFVETDCPYLAPQPRRGKRNEPAFVNFTAQVLAEVRGLTVEDLNRASELNFFELFGVGSNAKTGTVAYQIRNSLYLNLTTRCTNDCVFCSRLTRPVVQGYNLKLDREPTADEVWQAVGDPANYVIKTVAAKIKAAGGRVRLNTNGHGNVIHKRNILPELKGLVDEVSVSLNSDSSETYDATCRPLPSFRGRIYDEIRRFIQEAKKYIPDVQATIVTQQEGVDESACEDIVKKEFDVNYRPRRYNLVG
jgi:TatD DNase family protein